MKPGPAPKPSKFKILSGIQSSKINKNEPKPDTSMPVMPKYIEGYARAVWKRYAPELNRIGVLTFTDRDAFAAFCQAVSDFKDAIELIKKEGAIIESPQGVKSHPAVTQRDKAMNQIRKFGNEFGLTPSSRSQLLVDVSGVDGKDDILD